MGGNSNSQEKGGGIHFIFQKKVRKALGWGSIKTVKQSPFSVVLKHISWPGMDKNWSQRKLPHIPSTLSSFSPGYLGHIDFWRKPEHEVCWGPNLTSIDSVRLLSTEAQLLWVNITPTMKGTIRKKNAEVEQKVMGSEVAHLADAKNLVMLRGISV